MYQRMCNQERRYWYNQLYSKKAFENGFIDDYEEYESIKDVASECQCFFKEQVFARVDEDCYIVASKRLGGLYINGFVSQNGKCNNVMSVLKWIYNISESFGHPRVFMGAKHDTSYPLVWTAAKHKKIKILYDRCFADDEVLYHSLVIRILKRK